MTVPVPSPLGPRQRATEGRGPRVARLSYAAPMGLAGMEFQPRPRKSRCPLPQSWDRAVAPGPLVPPPALPLPPRMGVPFKLRTIACSPWGCCPQISQAQAPGFPRQVRAVLRSGGWQDTFCQPQTDHCPWVTSELCLDGVRGRLPHPRVIHNQGHSPEERLESSRLAAPAGLGVPSRPLPPPGPPLELPIGHLCVRRDVAGAVLGLSVFPSKPLGQPLTCSSCPGAACCYVFHGEVLTKAPTCPAVHPDGQELLILSAPSVSPGRLVGTMGGEGHKPQDEPLRKGPGSSEHRERGSGSGCHSVLCVSARLTHPPGLHPHSTAPCTQPTVGPKDLLPLLATRASWGQDQEAPTSTVF